MNRDNIKQLAHLARLHLEDQEVDTFTKQFDEIVGYVDRIKEESGSGSNYEIPDQVQDDRQRDNAPVNTLREDTVESYLDPEQIIDEAPSHQDNFVKVKKILQQ